MADGLSITVDCRPLLDAMSSLADIAEDYIREAAKVTADAVQRNARGIVARRTGATAADIVVREDFTGKGYIVTTADMLPGEVIAQRKRLVASDPRKYRNLKRRITAKYYQGEHVGLWLEGGTIQGAARSHTSAPRPFLHPAAALEEGPHRRRIQTAIERAVRAQGFRAD